jgi:hypothetical protein
MARIASSLPLVVALLVLIPLASLPADPPADDAAIKHTLALQNALQQARYYLQHGNDSKKAVELLEAQLAAVNGNAEFLRLLREAYRAHIRDLYLISQPAQAEIYVERLCVLEPGAAKDPTLRPAPETQRKIEPPAAKPVEPKQASIFPDFGKLLKPAGKAEAAPPKIRAQSAEEKAPGDDPFDAKHKRDLPRSGERAALARQLVAKADAEFKQKHYGQARSFYEQAHHADADSVADCRERWAYCVFDGVVEQLNQPTLGGKSLADLRQQIQGAVALAPSQGKTGQWLLEQIDQRGKSPAGAATTAFSVANLKHLGQNPEGWQVAETANFRIFHKQDAAFAEKVAAVAERTRLEMARKWFGSEGPAWQPRCELIVYPSRDEYRHMTAAPFDSPGHAHINSDPGDASRVIARWMHMRLDAAGMLEAVLPHETTHVVLAGRFGPFPVPRWADEGIAVLTEPEAKVQQHRQNLVRCQQDGVFFGLKELMTMEKYPTEPMRVTAFYAQSVALVELLTRQRGPTVFTSFVRDGLREGYEAALQRHYGMTFAQLQQAWNQHVLGAQKLASGN